MYIILIHKAENVNSQLSSTGKIRIKLNDVNDMAPAPNSTNIYFCPNVSHFWIRRYIVVYRERQNLTY